MMMGLWILVWLVAIVGLLGGGIWLAARLSGRAGNDRSGSILPWSQAGEQPLGREILQERYARGEIDREQYLEMQADLD